MTDLGISSPSRDGAALSSPASEHWSWLGILGSRFGWAYVVLQWGPLITGMSIPILTAGIVGGTGNWARRVSLPVGGWVIANVLALPEHSPPGLSANDLTLVAGQIALAVVSAGLALFSMWVVKHSEREAKAFAAMHTFVRVMLATVLLTYGWAKILPVQFAVSLDYLTLEVGQHNPRDLLWAFMGASRFYQIFAGVIEVAGAVLLLSSRTTMLGALISVAAMTNVVAMDIGYDLPVKFLAIQLLLLTMFVLSPYLRPLIRLIVMSRAAEAVRLGPVVIGKRRRIVGVLGMALGSWICYSTFSDRFQVLDGIDAQKETPVYGMWDVEGMSINGQDVPVLATDETVWRRFVVYSPNAAVAIPMLPVSGPIRSGMRWGLRMNVKEHTFQLARSRSSDTGEPLTFRYNLPDRDRLILTSPTPGGAMRELRFRRFDPENYPLMNWEPRWRW